MIGARVATALTLMAAACMVNVAPAQANPLCNSDGQPADAATRPYDGGVVWISGNGLIGVTTPDGVGSVRVPSASPMPLQAMVVDAENNGQHQLIVSNGRSAHLFALTHCWILTLFDGQGEPFVFDLQNLRGKGTGVGCEDLGDGRHLVALQSVPDGVNRTQINLDGTSALPGRSDTVPSDPSAQTITCGDQTMANNGVQQP